MTSLSRASAGLVKKILYKPYCNLFDIFMRLKLSLFIKNKFNLRRDG